MRRRKARLLLVSGEHLSCWICVQFWTSGLCFRNCSSRNWNDNGGLGFFFPGTQCFVLITSNVCIRIIAAKLRKGEEERRVDRLHKYTYAYVCVYLEITLCTGICHSFCECVCKQKKVKENLFKGNNCVYNYVCLYGFVSMRVGVGTSILYFRMRYFYGGEGKQINENR